MRIQKMWLGGQIECFQNVEGQRCIRCIKSRGDKSSPRGGQRPLCPPSKFSPEIIDSIVKGLETAHVRPLKCVRTPRAILVTSCYELSQFRAPEKERTRKIKDEEDASSRSYEIFNNIITFWK